MPRCFHWILLIENMVKGRLVNGATLKLRISSHPKSQLREQKDSPREWGKLFDTFIFLTGFSYGMYRGLEVGKKEIT